MGRSRPADRLRSLGRGRAPLRRWCWTRQLSLLLGVTAAHRSARCWRFSWRVSGSGAPSRTVCWEAAKRAVAGPEVGTQFCSTRPASSGSGRGGRSRRVAARPVRADLCGIAPRAGGRGRPHARAERHRGSGAPPRHDPHGGHPPRSRARRRPPPARARGRDRRPLRDQHARCRRGHPRRRVLHDRMVGNARHDRARRRDQWIEWESRPRRSRFVGVRWPRRAGRRRRRQAPSRSRSPILGVAPRCA